MEQPFPDSFPDEACRLPGGRPDTAGFSRGGEGWQRFTEGNTAVASPRQQRQSRQDPDGSDMRTPKRFVLRCPPPQPPADGEAEGSEQRPDDEGGGFGDGCHGLDKARFAMQFNVVSMGTQCC
jgi:hypothetical protein